MRETMVTLQFKCERMPPFLDKKVTEENLKDILKISSDFQHDNITIDTLYTDNDISHIMLHIYTEDIDDMARTKQALHDLIDFLLYNR